jgi:5-methylcytosine-specific restriction endonuclease McrA
MSKKNKYKDYLKSDEWADIRAVVIEIHGSICQSCLEKTRYPQIHHLTYKNLYNEEPEDLTLLCKKCHEKTHGIKKRIKYNKRNFGRIVKENARLREIIIELQKQIEAKI